MFKIFNSCLGMPRFDSLKRKLSSCFSRARFPESALVSERTSCSSEYKTSTAPSVRPIDFEKLLLLVWVYDRE